MQDGQIPVVPIVLAIFAIIAFAAFIGMLILFGFLIWRAAKRRAYDTARGKQMHSAAAQIGFDFQAQAALSTLPFFTAFELFEGSPLRFENLMRGKVQGCDAAIFDLAYRNAGGSSGGGTTTSRETMYAVTSPDLDLPEFYLRPEGILEKVLNTVSRVDIDFAERPDFSQKFLLYGKDGSAIRQIFTTPKLDFFERNPNICVFGRGNYLFLYQSRTLTPPAQIGEYLDYFGDIQHLFRSRPLPIG